MKTSDIDREKYQNGMSFLYQSGVLQFLRQQGEVRTVPPGAVNYSELHIAEANRSIGYLQALGDLLEFKERFLEVSLMATPVKDYGATDKLVKQKIITQEEADELKQQFA